MVTLLSLINLNHGKDISQEKNEQINDTNRSPSLSTTISKNAIRILFSSLVSFRFSLLVINYKYQKAVFLLF